MARPTFTNLELQRWVREWLKELRTQRSLALNFTFRGRTSLIEAQEVIRLFFRFVDRAVFKRGSGADCVHRLPVIEEGLGGQRHWHALVIIPAWMQSAEFARICSEKWDRIRCSGRSRQIGVSEGSKFFDYITKLETKPNFMECIFVQEVRLGR